MKKDFVKTDEMIFWMADELKEAFNEIEMEDFSPVDDFAEKKGYVFDSEKDGYVLKK